MNDSPFIGRARPLERLLALGLGAASGRGACGFVRGPPGVGKSSLAREVLARLAAGGVRTAAAGA